MSLSSHHQRPECFLRDSDEVLHPNISEGKNLLSNRRFYTKRLGFRREITVSDQILQDGGVKLNSFDPISGCVEIIGWRVRSDGVDSRNDGGSTGDYKVEIVREREEAEVAVNTCGKRGRNAKPSPLACFLSSRFAALQAKREREITRRSLCLFLLSFRTTQTLYLILPLRTSQYTVMGYIGAHGVAALHRYKYSGVDHSYLAKYVLQPFWTRFVKVFPLWMPPNMITLMGFMFLLTSALLGYIYSPQLDSPPPRWVHFAHGLLLFLYQTFDAVDGKQARRTNSSSPLGELFDHGCDALACAFEAMAFGSTAMCGRDTFWFWVISAIPFYGATWEHYFTNTLILPVINGPTEGLALIFVSHFFTAIVGAEWWAQQLGQSIPLFSWVPFVNAIQTSRAVLYMMIAFAVIPTVAFNVSNVYKVVQSRKGSMVLALAMLYPFVVLLGGVLIWDYLSPINLIATYPHFVVLGTGLAFGFLVGRMILAHLCDEPKGLKTNMCMSLLYLPFALANALTARLNAGVPLVDELWVLLGYCIFTVSLYLHFATSVIHEITEALGIYCFRITRKEA